VSDRSDDAVSSARPDVTALLGDGGGVGRWVLDPAGSRAEFHVKHFWGAVTVHGSFGQITGEGAIGMDGTVTGRLSIAAPSLGTKNKKRDEHLRSAEFFDVEHHPEVVVTVTDAQLAGLATLACRGTLEAAGHTQAISFNAQVEDASAQAATVRAELLVDRTGFSMTWSPLGMASKNALATVVARFVRP